MSRLAVPSLASMVVVSALALDGSASAQCPSDPPPVGPSVSPSNDFDVGEYARVHSSTLLQSFPSHEKFATGLFWHPAGDFGTGFAGAFSGFSSAIVVNNPDPLTPVAISIEYHGPDGAILARNGPITIAPNGMFVEDAGTLGLGAAGVGSARVVVDASTPPSHAGIVGATLHYFDSIGVPVWGAMVDPDIYEDPATGELVPGAGEGSYQQLQISQPFSSPAGIIFAGPYRLSNDSSSDFDNGAAPLLVVTNPHDQPAPVAIVAYATGANGLITPVVGRIEQLPPRGMVLDTSLWSLAHQIYATLPGHYEIDMLVAVIPLGGTKPGSAGAVIGEALVIDCYGDDEGAAVNRNLNFGTRMRMASTAMMRPSGILHACEVTCAAPSDDLEEMVTTRVHVANTAFAQSPPLVIDYFDHDGTLLGSDRVPNGLAPGATLHIGRDELQSPNFPCGIRNGTVRVYAAGCASAALVGWTHREVRQAPLDQLSPYQHFKAFGEEMGGSNQSETFPLGWPQTIGANGQYIEQLWRRTMPIVRTLGFAPQPARCGFTTYSTFAWGPQGGNAGRYSIRFFEQDGADATNIGAQPFPGLQFGASTLTYEDSDPAPYANLSLITGNGGIGSGTVDEIDYSGGGYGVQVLGEPFADYGLGLFARRGLGPKPGDAAFTGSIERFDGSAPTDQRVKRW